MWKRGLILHSYLGLGVVLAWLLQHPPSAALGDDLWYDTKILGELRCLPTPSHTKIMWIAEDQSFDIYGKELEVLTKESVHGSVISGVKIVL